MKFLGLALSLVVGFASTANASIFAEPYLGYGLGSYEDDGDKGTMNGPVLGARVGGEMSMLFFGADYSMGLSGKVSPDDNSGDVDFTTSMLYGVVGVNLPIIRGWVGYGLMNEAKVKDPGGEATISGGSHIKLGLGLKLIPMVSINLEYIMADWKKAEQGANSGDSTLESNTVLISASVPLSF